jgi:hypothetical protein
MTRRAWWLISGAYALLAIGAVITLAILSMQADDIKATNDRLIGAAAAYCQAGIAPDSQEREIIDELSRGDYGPDEILELDPICQRIVARLRHGDE